ncbi:hypothetical protein D3C79_914590 [compost metagenome]
MVKRYEIPDAAWELVADLFDQPRRSGRPRADDRLMLNGVLWVLCSGAAWRDMPERFGPWSTVYQRFRDWRMRSMKRKPKPGLPRLFDRPKYRQRNIIERMFGWLKENRRIVTRFDKLAKSYAAMGSLACAMRCLRHYFSYSA